MLIERLESYYRAKAEERNAQPQAWARASALGMCARRLGYMKLGVIGEPLTPRRFSIFNHGDVADMLLKDDLAKALGGGLITSGHRGSVMIEGVEVTGECDGFFNINNRYGVVDFKSMADYSFDLACKGEIDETYAVQGYIYSLIYEVDIVVFVCLRKETSHLVEVIFDKQATELITTRRYGGDEREIQVNDPLLIAEVRSPFDVGIAEKVKTTILQLVQCDSPNTLPDGVNAIEAETIKVQGAEKAKAKAVELGLNFEEAVKSGSWFGMATGRKILGFPCGGYCPFMRQCFPQIKLEIEGGRPKWVIEGPAKGG